MALVHFPVTAADLPGLVPNDQGWMHDVEVAAIVGFATCIACHMDRPIDVLEVGCYRGRTSKALVYVDDVRLTVIDNFRGPTDHPEVQGLRDAFERNMSEGGELVPGLTIVEGDSAECMQRMHENGDRFELILIDGDHRAEGVARDLRAAWPLLNEAGYLFLDDINWESVRDGFQRWWPRDMRATPHVIPVSPKLAYVRKVGGKPCTG